MARNKSGKFFFVKEIVSQSTRMKLKLALRFMSLLKSNGVCGHKWRVICFS
jgi:hypothetical protein